MYLSVLFPAYFLKMTNESGINKRRDLSQSSLKSVVSIPGVR